MSNNNPALSLPRASSRGPSNGLIQALTRESVLIAASVRFWRAAKKLQAIVQARAQAAEESGFSWRMSARPRPAGAGLRRGTPDVRLREPTSGRGRPHPGKSANLFSGEVRNYEVVSQAGDVRLRLLLRSAQVSLRRRRLCSGLRGRVWPDGCSAAEPDEG